MPPKHGRAVELHPGLHWARMQLPFPPGDVNIWLLSDPSGWTIVDTGLDTPDARVHILDILRQLGNPPIRRVLVTHSHIDHIGLAGWLCRTVAAPLAMPQVEWLNARVAMLNADVSTHQDFFREAGCPPSFIDHLPDYRAWFTSQFSELPDRYQRIREGMSLMIGQRRWQVMTGGGHAPEQAMLYNAEDRILLGADHVLETIKPAISCIADELQSDPLSAYFATLSRLHANLPIDTTVLPSHGVPFKGLHSRIELLKAHHTARLAKLESRLADGQTAFEALSLVYSRPMSLKDSRIPVSDIFAHLNHLEMSGRLRSTLDNGVRRFMKL